MKDYDKNYFWTVTDPVTLETKYYFNLNGVMVEVTKEVYNCCFSCYVKELRYNRRLEKNPVLSLDYENEESHRLIDNVSDKENMEEKLLNMFLMEKIMKEIEKLDAEEKRIILENLLQGKSLRKLSSEMNVPLMTLHDRKKKILKRLKKKIEE